MAELSFGCPFKTNETAVPSKKHTHAKIYQGRLLVHSLLRLRVERVSIENGTRVGLTTKVLHRSQKSLVRIFLNNTDPLVVGLLLVASKQGTHIDTHIMECSST